MGRSPRGGWNRGRAPARSSTLSPDPSYSGFNSGSWRRAGSMVYRFRNNHKQFRNASTSSSGRYRTGGSICGTGLELSGGEGARRVRALARKWRSNCRAVVASPRRTHRGPRVSRNASMRGSSSVSTPQVLVLEPTTEIADEPKLAHRRWASVSLCLKLSGEPVEITGQQTDTQPPPAGSTGEIKPDRHRPSPSRWLHCQREKTTGLFRKINHREPTQHAEVARIPGIDAWADPE